MSCEKNLVDVRSDDVIVSSVPVSDNAFMSLKGSVTPFRTNPKSNGDVELTYVIISSIEVAISAIRLKTERVSEIKVEQFIESSLTPFYSEVSYAALNLL